jgi:putative selenium metabolism protein SsnA
MGSLLITNGTLVTLDEENRCIDAGNIYVEDGRILEAGSFPSTKYAAERTIDARGNLVMPGLINAHHHLYSTFARGLSPPGEPAKNFEEILANLWWKLDKALGSEDVYYSALLALIESARAGCTTVIDHHASPSCCDGSLDQVERAFRDTGLSGCLCYEISDRNRPGDGVDENLRFIDKCARNGDGQIVALLGLHASMTIGPETLERCADIVRSRGVGCHVHVAEDMSDVASARQRHGMSILERFAAAGITGPKSILVHGVHLDAADIDIVSSTDSMLVNCPESNMNNAVGIAPVLEMLQRGVLVGLGTDGMSSHLLSQARAMYLQQRVVKSDPRVGFIEACDALARNNRTIANRLFADERGQLAPGQLADIVIIDYLPPTPLQAETLPGHLLFGVSFARVLTTIARGRVIVDAGRFVDLDEAAVRAQCAERVPAIWQRMLS